MSFTKATATPDQAEPAGDLRIQGNARNERQASRRRITRRKFLRRALFGTVAAPVVLGGYAWRVEPVWETINRGIGWIKRIRFCARPEITEFTLTSI